MSEQQAFPLLDMSQNNSTGDTFTHQSIGGLTKREYFAGLAMQGLLASEESDRNVYETRFARNAAYARNAVGYADALLAELAKRGEG